MNSQAFSQRKRLFACQGLEGSVGKPWGFPTLEGFHKFAVQKCGFQGYSLPVGDNDKTFDLPQAIKDPEGYPQRLNDRMMGYGYLDAIDRVEYHTKTQGACLAPSRRRKMGPMLHKNWRNMTVRQLENSSVEDVKQLIRSCSKANIKYIIAFFGGRGFAVAQSKWPGYPFFFKEWVLGTLVSKWEGLLEYAADHGVIICHEIGHEESDLFTGENFKIFYGMLSEKAKKGCGILFDMSHFMRQGVNPIPHLVEVIKTGCAIQNHYKGAVIRDFCDGTCSNLGGLSSWDKASHTFTTFGTTGDEAIIREFHRLMVAAGAHAYHEAECIVANPLLNMEYGSMNIDAVENNTQLVRFDNVGPEVQPMILGTTSPDLKAFVILPNGERREVEPPAQSFDKVFTNDDMPFDWLELEDDEVKAVRSILGRSGYEQASLIGLAS